MTSNSDMKSEFHPSHADGSGDDDTEGQGHQMNQGVPDEQDGPGKENPTGDDTAANSWHVNQAVPDEQDDDTQGHTMHPRS